MKLYTFVSFVSFAVLVLFVSHPSSEFNKNDESDTSTLQPIQTLQKLTAELSEEDDTVQNQPIHWLAAVICVNTGNFVSLKIEVIYGHGQILIQNLVFSRLYIATICPVSNSNSFWRTPNSRAELSQRQVLEFCVL